MENNLDREIREKLQHREIQPSASAWERLSAQLDAVEEKKKKNWFLYIGYAASIALIVSLFFILQKKDQNESDIPENVIVEETVEEPKIDKTKEFNTLPVENDAIVENKVESVEEQKKEKGVQKKVVPTFKKTITDPKTVIAQQEKPKVKLEKTEKLSDVQKTIKEIVNDDKTVVADLSKDKTNTINSETKKINTNSISVDSEALLFSVTNTREDIRAYYKKYKIDRQEVLLAIEKQLKKSSLQIDPKTILAEVERDVNEESFQNNFYQFIKKRVSGVATAIANRNN
ncbi:hypothetical protein [Pseudotenacibaculum haliotis]|uniref:Uncharacterized protein n=1 Tax=Pseudotenacibaculum haliotis TaxID=1862138 RepID=A0ABW5LT12_9FLAO